jgi:acetoin utilization protein AcuB
MLVRDVMATQVVTVRPEASIFRALDLLRTLEVRLLPVVDERGVLKGVLTDRELVRGAAEPAGAVSTVADVMAREGVFTFAASDVRDPARRMAEWRVGAVPVIDRESRLVGIVTYADVLRAMLDAA